MKVFVVGRFPPPIDGQSLATERLASLLQSEANLERLNIQPPQSDAVGDERQRLRRIAHFLSVRPRLKESLGRNPDATVLWSAVSPDPAGHLRDLLVTVAAFKRGHRVYAVVHRGNFHRMFQRPFTAPSARYLVKRLTGFVFNTEHLSDRCAKWIPASKRIVIPNTIDDDVSFSSADVTEKQLRRKTRAETSVLFISHMLPSKGYLDVLEGMIQVQQNGLRIEGHFVGGWQHRSDKDAFFARIRNAGLEDVITHHGAVSDRNAIRERYLRADVLLLPTYYANEAQPHVLIEAMNAGIPVVTTRHAGISEMIRDGEEGLLVPARSPRALADAIIRLANVDFWNSISKRSRQTFLDTYSPEDVRRRWKDLVYDSIRRQSTA